MTVSDLANLAVSLFVPGATGPATWHFDSRQISYISPPGDFTGATVMPLDPQSPTTQSWFWLAGIEVLAPRHSGAIAALGDIEEACLSGQTRNAKTDGIPSPDELLYEHRLSVGAAVSLLSPETSI